MEKNDEQKAEPIEIAPSQLQEDTLSSLVQEFVLREGTDYGSAEVSLSMKVAQVLKQIEKGEIKLFFDPDTESVNIVRSQVRPFLRLISF